MKDKFVNNNDGGSGARHQSSNNSFLKQIYNNTSLIPLKQICKPVVVKDKKKQPANNNKGKATHQMEEFPAVHPNSQYPIYIQNVQKEANRANFDLLRNKKRPLTNFQNDAEFQLNLPAPLYKPDFTEEENYYKPQIAEQERKQKPFQDVFFTSTASESSASIQQNEKDSSTTTYNPLGLITQKPEQNFQQDVVQSTRISVNQLIKPHKLIERPQISREVTFNKEIMQEEEEERFVDKLKSEQKQKRQLNYAFSKLNEVLYQDKQQREVGIQLDQDGKPCIALGQFDFQPHLLYRHQVTDKIPVEAFQKGLQIENNSSKVQGAILSSVRLAYSFCDLTLQIWKIQNSDINQKIKFTEPILSVNIIEILKQLQKQFYLIVTTPNQITKFEFYPVLQKDQILRHQQVEVLSSDGYNMSELLQLQNGRIFVGGQQAIWKEIDLFSHSFISGKAKMKKIDESQGLINKLIPSFFKTNKDQLIVDMVEHKRLNAIFFAIQDYRDHKKTHISIYDTGRQCNDSIVKLQNINLSEIIEKIVYNASPNQQNQLKHLLKEKMEISKLITSENTPHQLIIALNNGMRIFIQMEEQYLSYEEYKKVKWVKSGSGNSSQAPINYKPSVLDPSWAYQIVQLINSPIDYALDKYYEVWNENIQNENSNQWRSLACDVQPLSYGFFSQMAIEYSIVSFEQNNTTQEEFFAIKTINGDYFVIYSIFDPNQEGELKTRNIYKVSIRRIECGKIYDISSERFRDKSQVLVLTDLGIQRFNVPSSSDVLASYLKLSIDADPLSKALIDDDLQNYLKSQNQLEILVMLLQITVGVKVTDTFLMSSMTQLYYQTKAKAVSQNYSLRDQMKILVQTMSNYLKSEQCFTPLLNNNLLQAMAIDIFMNLTEPGNIQENLFQNNDQMVIGTTDYNQQGAIDGHQLVTSLPNQIIPEQERIVAFNIYLARQFDPLYNKTLFIRQDEAGKNLVQNISPEELNQVYNKVEGLLRLISQFKGRFQSIEDHSGVVIVESLSYKDTFESFLLLLHRLKGGLMFIRQLFELPKLRSLLSSELNQAQRNKLLDLTLSDILIQGLVLEQVSDLINILLDQIPTNQLASQLKEFKLITRVFIQQEFVDLYQARRYLREDLATQDMSSYQNYLSQGVKILLSRSLDAILPLALSELLKNDLINQAVQFCLKKAQDIERQKEYAQSLLKKQDVSKALVLNEETQQDQDQIQAKISQLEEQQDECFYAIKEIVRVIVERIKQVDLAEKIKNKIIKDKKEIEKAKATLKNQKSSDFDGVNILMQRLQQVNDVYILMKAKDEVLLQATKNTDKFAALHRHLSYYLYQEGLTQDLVKLKSPYVQEFMQLIQNEVEPTENLTVDEKQQRQLTNLELTYTQLQHDPELCFLKLVSTLYSETCVIDIEDRIAWMHKADGCYHKISINKQSQSASDGKLRFQLQEQLDKLLLLKELIYTTHQMREKTRKFAIKREKMVDFSADEKQDQVELDKYLSTQLLDWEQLYQIAFNHKMWTLVIKIIQQSSTHHLEKLNPAQIEDMQNEIDFAYENIITNYSKADQLPLEKQVFNKLVIKILGLGKKYGKNRNPEQYSKFSHSLDFFPVPFIVDNIQKQNMSYLYKRKDGTYLNKKAELGKEWHPFWYLVLLIENNFATFPQLFEILYNLLDRDQKNLKAQQIQADQDEGPQLTAMQNSCPELAFSLLYLVNMWFSTSTSSSDYLRSTFTQKHYQQAGIVLSQTKEAFKDELCFSKEYYTCVEQFLKKVGSNIAK